VAMAELLTSANATAMLLRLLLVLLPVMVPPMDTGDRGWQEEAAAWMLRGVMTAEAAPVASAPCRSSTMSRRSAPIGGTRLLYTLCCAAGVADCCPTAGFVKPCKHARNRRLIGGLADYVEEGDPLPAPHFNSSPREQPG